MTNIAIIGECMLELSAAGQSTAGAAVRPMELRFGGDTLNTAIYLARAGISVSYATVLGDDAYSDWMLEQWHTEGVRCDLVLRAPGRLPGLYAIETNDGERSFNYWRGESPARELFATAAPSEDYLAKLADHDMIYFSGITLSLYSPKGRARLFEFLKGYRANGGRVAFDTNYREAGWPDRDTARDAIAKACHLADISLPSGEDEKLLFGYANDEAILEGITGRGAREVVLKLGGGSCVLVYEDRRDEIKLSPAEKIRDTTAAGDSFNAGYLGARLRGRSPQEAVAIGHRLARVVIGYQGAIIPADASAKALEDI